MNKSKNEKVLKDLLAERFYFYQIFHMLFAQEPDHVLIEELSSDRFEKSLDFALSESTALEDFKDFLTVLRTNSLQKEYIDLLSSEYTRLLIGPDKLIAYPWESTYINESHLLMQESTLDVRSFYSKNGYQAKMLHRVADDHIALMLDFLAKMSERSLAAFEADDYGSLEHLLSNQSQFLDQHMLNWIPEYVACMQADKKAYFYPLVLRMLLAYIRSDKMNLSVFTTNEAPVLSL